MKKIGLIFPGQGSQYVGMGQDLYEHYSVARQTFAEAHEALGFDLAAICFAGPEEKLKLTAITQPAVLTVSVAMWRVIQSEEKVKPVVAAGHSLGEYGALVAAEALPFAEAVRLVHWRGKFMQEAVPVGEGAMAAIMNMSSAEVADLCTEAAQGEVLTPANYNSPGQIVIAGHKGAVERAVAMVAKKPGKKAVLLPVSAPFHCPLMRPAGERLQEVLAQINFSDPIFPVLANAEADFYPGKEAIKELLVKQVDHPVRWEECLQKLLNTGVDMVWEVGPGKVLTGLLRRINREIPIANIEDKSSWEKAKACLKIN
ncbi:MAG: ACP S-malonyltransferase [Thermodesulfobacteriota bacterium]